MAHENKAGLGGVHNHYGPRSTGTSVGVETSGGSSNSLSLYFTKETLQDTFIPPVVLPLGAIVKDIYLTVDEAFTGLTSLSVGKEGAEATDGVTLTAAELAAVGGFNLPTAGVGEFGVDAAGGLSAPTKLGIVVTGTPTEGQATLTVEYYYKARTVGV